MSKIKYQNPQGMHDILPEDQPYYETIFEVIKNFFDFYHFKKIDTPILEYADLFERSVGQDTDIVQKEMYTFRTKGGKDVLTLRPEGTAPIMRAYLQYGFHSLPQPVKLWYYGPFFRHERPQAGRYRQFYQFGAEILGESEPVADAELISINYEILQELKLNNLIVRVNSIGDESCRSDYKKALNKFLRAQKNALCLDCQKRSKINPLRVLDCKNEKCREVLKEAPQSVDYLCEDCHIHFKDVLEYLDEMRIPYLLDPFLVRGLDYYTRTVFEIEPTDMEQKAQGSLSGGGRYDSLAKALGSRIKVPSVGMAGGIERIIALMKAKDYKPKTAAQAQIFLAQIGPLAKKKCLAIMQDLRKANLRVVESLGKNSLKAQLGLANKLGINNVLIIGQKEALQGTVVIRNMETGKQLEVRQEEIVKAIKQNLKN